MKKTKSTDSVNRKKKKRIVKEYYPTEPYKRANYVSSGCTCTGCMFGVGHIIGYFNYEK